MTSDRKKPSAGFWITVALVAVLIGYPLSYGPVVWLDNTFGVPKSIQPAVGYFYFPLGWLDDNGPQPFNEFMEWYVRLWVRNK
jgi:hypothetical protein